ncbi:VOC family protein [Nostocoides australiense]
MRVDHVSYAAEPDGLHATAERLAAQLGVTPVEGGIHPRFGTRNIILPLAHERYVEVVEVLDHPSADKAPFGQAVRQRSEIGGGWLGWVVRVDALSDLEERLGRSAVDGNRRMPDGREFKWRQLGVRGLQSDPQLPFFVEWDADSPHPSDEAHTQVTMTSMQIAGDPDRVKDWLGLPAETTSTVIHFDFVAPHGTPGLMSVTFNTPDGDVTV